MSDPLVFEVVVTAGDQIALTLHIHAQPSVRWRRCLMFLVLGTLGAGIGLFAAGTSVMTVIDGLSDARTRPTVMMTLFPLVLISGSLVVAEELLRRFRIARFVKRALKDKPDIDSTDPQLRQRGTSSFGFDGYTWTTPDEKFRRSWDSIQRIDETEKHLFMMCGLYMGIVFPKRCLSNDLIGQIKTIVASNTCARTFVASKTTHDKIVDRF